MVTRRNLALVPALKVDNTGNPNRWFGPSGWARITGAHASLPRSTAFAGTNPGDLAASRVDVVAGRYYVMSVSARFVAPSTGAVNIDWYGGLGYLVTTSGPAYSQASGTTNRFAVMAQAPADAVRGVLVPAGIDGESQWTALMVEEFETLVAAEAALAYSTNPANYFDGDTAGATWDGDDGESTSTFITDEPAYGLADLAAAQAGGLGVRTSLDGTGLADLPAPLAATGLFASATYDDRRGRIRLDVQGLASNVLRVIVYSRRGGTSKWKPVRGGRVAVESGTLVRRVDDYEWQAGAPVEYKIDALSSPENIQPEAVVQTAYTSLSTTPDAEWLKFIARPHANLPVKFIADKWSLERETRNTEHKVEGNPLPIVLTEVHGSRKSTVRFLTHTDDEYRALDAALSAGAPAYLQLPVSTPFPSMYVTFGNYRADRVGAESKSRTYVFSVAITEVAAPPPSITGSGLTWGTLLEQFETWADVLDAFETWNEVIS